MNTFKEIYNTDTVQRIKHDLGDHTAATYVNAVMMLYNTGEYTCHGHDLERGKICDILFELFGPCMLNQKYDNRQNIVYSIE